MGQVIIRNLDDSVVANLKRMAAREDKSLEQFLREVLEERIYRQREGFLEFARGVRERCKPTDIDPTDLIREDRDR
jgi:plasmid stability protein